MSYLLLNGTELIVSDEWEMDLEFGVRGVYENGWDGERLDG